MNGKMSTTKFLCAAGAAAVLAGSASAAPIAFDLTSNGQLDSGAFDGTTDFATLLESGLVLEIQSHIFDGGSWQTGGALQQDPGGTGVNFAQLGTQISSNEAISFKLDTSGISGAWWFSSITFGKLGSRSAGDVFAGVNFDDTNGAALISFGPNAYASGGNEVDTFQFTTPGITEFTVVGRGGQFSIQEVVAIPLPTGAGLAGLGLGLVALRRRR